MSRKKEKIHPYAAALMVVAFTFLRVVPDLAFFTPVIALALFSGVYFNTPKSAFLVPMGAMGLSDFVLFLYDGLLLLPLRVVSYLGLTAIIAVGFYRLKNAPSLVFMLSLLGCALFFSLMIGLADWSFNLCGAYPKTMESFLAYQVDSWPVLRNTALSSCFYGGILLVFPRLLLRTFPALGAR